MSTPKWRREAHAEGRETSKIPTTRTPDMIFLVVKDLGHEIGLWAYTKRVAAKARIARTGGLAYEIDMTQMEEVKL